MNYNTLSFEIEKPSEGLIFSPSSLYGHLLKLKDKRGKQGRQYELAVIVSLAILAKLADQDQVAAIAHWCKLRETQIIEWLGLKLKRLPHYGTWLRILGEAFEVLELQALVKEFLQGAANKSEVLPPRGTILVALDGKTLRGTIPFGHSQGVHLVAAYQPNEGLVLAQLAVAQKGNEITIAPQVLEQIELRGRVVVGDAMFAQKNLSVQIVGGGGDYGWSSKGNQKGILEDIEILFEESEPVAAGCSATPTDFESYRQVDKGHGRLEERLITVSRQLLDYTPFPHLTQVFKLESRVTRGGKTTVAVRYGLTSLTRELADAKRLLELVRGEWAIENRLHYRRDNTLREDWSQVRLGQAPQVLVTLNNTILSLLDKRRVTNVAKARREFAFNPSLAFKFLFS